MIDRALPKRDRFHVVTSDGTVVEISPAAREEIIAALRGHEQGHPELSFHRALRAFEDAGESGRVSLDTGKEANLIDTIRTLAEHLGGESHLDPGVTKLYRTLLKEVHSRWAEEERQSVVAQASAWFRERGFLMAFETDERPDGGADWWTNLHRIGNVRSVIRRYARGSSDEEAAARARERYEQEQ